MIVSEIEKPHVLIVDDEACVRGVLGEILSEKYHCAFAASAEEALDLLRKKSFNLVLSDINMSGMSGIEMIPRVAEIAPDAVILTISGQQTVECAIEAVRGGAFDYIKKPFEIEHVEIAVERALKHHELLAEKRRYENHLKELVKQRTAQLDYLAYHDAPTDLPNRVLFEDRLSQSLAAARHLQINLAVILFSVDRFKKIRDTLGHEASARILREIAGRLKSCVGDAETVAKFEAEEFGFLLKHVQNSKKALKVIRSVNEALKTPVIVDDHEVFVTASIGISIFPNDGEDVSTLLKNAAAAVSRAREKGGANAQFYTADMNAKALRRLELENNLRRAVEREEFEVYYQPKIDGATRQISGMEALIRWHHPEFGLVSPLEFIPLAEETGLIQPIGEWVLRTACAACKKWRDEGFDLVVSVNISPHQFQPDLPAMIDRVVRETAFDYRRLELEITESSIMKNAEFTARTLGALREKGVKISIDDFGTGYSSLGYLKSLPIDALKIDKSFVRDLTADPDDAALVMAIITLAHNLRLKVIAEGVETEEQLRFLRLLRCDEWQGFLYSRPIPAGEFEKLLRGEIEIPPLFQNDLQALQLL